MRLKDYLFPNNDLEQAFGTLRHHQRRCTGRKVAPSSLQDLRKDARCRVGSNKLDTNRRMFELFERAIRKPLVFQLVNGLRTQHS